MKGFRIFATWRLAAVAAVFLGLVDNSGIGSTAARAQSVPAEIVELARGLKNDPDLIFEYVYNNIETLPQYGSLKGPLGTLLDGKGSAFDQAELMVSLLRQAGLTASYQIGQIQLTAAQITNWLGTDTSEGSVNYSLGSGGFPGTTIVTGNVVVGAQLGWAWVLVTIGGVDYVFDPATKTYARSTGIGTAALASALGYTQSSFIADAAVTGTSTSHSRGKTLIEIQDLQGRNLVTTNVYDGLDRLTSTTQPEGISRSYTYDPSSDVLTATVTPKPGSPLSPLTTTYSYDPLFNKPTRITDPLGLVTTMAYDGATGNLLSRVADAGSAPHLNARTTFTYNGYQLTTATDPLGRVTLYRYDQFGNPTRVTRDYGSGRLNLASTLAYSAVGDVVAATDPNGRVVTSTYDPNRQRTTVTSPGTAAAPNGLVTVLSYDANGRVVRAQQLANGIALTTRSTTYTLTGQPASATDAKGNVTTYAYDVLDRLSGTTDALGRVTSYTYDALSRRTKVLNTAIQAGPLLQQTYTADGLPAVLTDANGHTTSFAYDGLDRLASLTYPDASTQALSYDADSNVLSRTTRAGQTIGFGYDTLNRLVTKTPPAPMPTVTYAYDLAGRLTAVGDNSAPMAAAVPPSGPFASYAASYAYDSLNRPTAVSWSPAPTAAAPVPSTVTFAHAYTRTNQRAGQTTTDNSFWAYPPAVASTVSYTANALDQYTAVGPVTPTYDGNGNLTSDGTFAYGFDAENRLVSATGAGNSASYAYDAQGRRKLKTVNGTSTAFVTDADNREVLEYDGASGQILCWYAHGLGSNDALNQMNVPAATRATLVPDIQGSIIAALDSASGALAKTGYLPYGRSAGTPASFGYTGQRFDAETNGLYYYRSRAYSPLVGRFLQVDPIGYGGGSNLYAYVGNDPLNLVDPFGTSAAGPNISYPSAGNILTSFVQGAIQSTFNAAWSMTGFSYDYGMRPPQLFNPTSLLGYSEGGAAAFGVLAASPGFLRVPGELTVMEAGSRALEPMSMAAYNTGTIRNIAGYEVGGNAGLVGSTYNMNIWALYATEQSQGLNALANAVRSEASAAGASNLSISGTSIINPGIANMNPAIAARYGLSFTQVDPWTILLQGAVP